ncbi:MAG TPA: LytR C-terminal domain-containing protein [Acidimicrobiales bacterium]|nr:LytR C-terminal domain-containing protein [Acidimicrobiales bacterium]
MLVLVAVAIGAAVLANLPQGASSRVAAGSAPTTTSTTAGASSTTTSTTLATHQPSQVKVLVANGTSTSGLGGKLASKLTNAGYDVLSPTNTSSSASASAVYYASGYQGDAAAVAQASGLTAGALQAMTSSVPVSDTKGAQVVVIIGPDLTSSLSSSSG